MEQNLLYRDVPYIIGPEQDGHRRWTVQLPGAEETGIAGGSGLRGSFKTAVMAAREAIDARLRDGGDAGAHEGGHEGGDATSDAA